MTEEGHGAGILISDDGLILTSYHVVTSGTSVDLERSASYMTVYLGQLSKQGRMVQSSDPIRAYVFDFDSRLDLALLGLHDVPTELGRLRTAKFAGEEPRPGELCAIIGHPLSGTLWAIRQGEISGLGESPRDLVQELLEIIRADVDVTRENIQTELESLNSHDIILSSCRANSGDSGGPLVNNQGEVIGVTYAVPRSAEFTYHVSLTELQNFVGNTSRKPTLIAPDVWALGHLVEIWEKDVLLAADGRNRQVLLDLDGDTPVELLETENFNELIGKRRFDLEVGVHYGRKRNSVFYDTDNDGEVDEILVYSNGSQPNPRLHSTRSAELHYRRDPDGDWRIDTNVQVRWLDPSPLEERRLRTLLTKMKSRIGL